MPRTFEVRGISTVKTMKILLVDDNPKMRSMVRDLIGSRAHNFYDVSEGDEEVQSNAVVMDANEHHRTMKIHRMNHFVNIVSTVFLLFLLPMVIHSQTIHSKVGTVLSLGTAKLSLPGHWVNYGTWHADTGTIIFNGGTIQTIFNSSPASFHHITVNKPAGDVQLLSSIGVNGHLVLLAGDLDMNGSSVSLGESAHVAESSRNTVKGTGAISGTRLVSSPVSLNTFGLGVTFTSDHNFGQTTVLRGHDLYTSVRGTGIKRYFDITPSFNNDLDATVVFTYDESELNGNPEDQLVLFSSTDSGTSWTLAGGTVDTAANTISVTGINSFSRWTIGTYSNPLPVELQSFTVTVHRSNAELQWKTGSEVHNYGFSVERNESDQWNQVTFIEGSGTSAVPKEYSYRDKNLTPGKYSYRLKQIDRDGHFQYSHTIEVSITPVPSVFSLEQNYPNPFNPSTMISFTLQQTGLTTLKVFDMMGREVADILNEVLEAGVFHQRVFIPSNLASGIYLTRLTSGKNVQSKKMLLIK